MVILSLLGCRYLHRGKENDMGVYIKDLKKPKDCYECPIAKSYLDCLMEKKYVCPIGRTDDCLLIDIVTCGECKHRPIKDDPEGADYGFNIVAPTDRDDLCPCLVEDGWYSWMPEDNFYCGRGERK